MSGGELPQAKKKISDNDLVLETASADFHVAENMILSEERLVTLKDNNNRSVLHWAALMNKQQLVEFLLGYPQCAHDEPDDTGATPLVLATLKGSLPIIKVLFEKGANINHQNNNGHSPLQYAGSRNHKEIFKFLLENNATVNVHDKIGDTVLHRIASTEHHECLQILLDFGTVPLQLDARNNQGNTPLHLACENSDSVSALLLVKKGASVECKNKDEQTPLDLAKPPLRKQILEKLAEATPTPAAEPQNQMLF